MSAQFNIRAADPASVSLLESELGLPRFIAATLVARGIRTPHDAREFLNPSLERDWLDPYDHPRPARGGRRAGRGHARRQAHRRVRRLRPGRHIGHHGAHAGPAHAGRPCHAVHPAALRRRLRPDRGRVRAHAGAESGIHRDRGLRHRLQGGGRGNRGGRRGPGHHRPSRTGRPGAGRRSRGRPEDGRRVRKLHPCRRGRGAQGGAGAGRRASAIRTCGATFTDLATLGTVADLMPMRGENRALVADGIAAHEHLAAALHRGARRHVGRGGQAAFTPPTSASRSSRASTPRAAWATRSWRWTC